MNSFFQYLLILGLAVLPAMGNFAGAVVAEFVKVTDQSRNLALHGAAGIIFGVVGIELMPRALESSEPWIVIAAYLMGGLAYIGVERLLNQVSARSKSDSGNAAWMIYFAVLVDLFSDGLLIGTSLSISTTLAILAAIAQVTADIPEGFAMAANFKNQKLSRSRRLWLGASLVIPCVLAASIGFWLLKDAADIWKFSALAFTAGILSLAAAEEMMNEAHEACEDVTWSAGFFILGFALFALLSSYFDMANS
jgi:zinc transporter, ZIP family